MQTGQLQIHFLFVLLLLTFVPCMSYGDCVITDTPYEFKVVCSGYNPLFEKELSAGRTVKSPGNTGKVKAEKDMRVPSAVAMSEEERQFMDVRNRQDGYRGKRNSGGSTTKKTEPGKTGNS